MRHLVFDTHAGLAAGGVCGAGYAAVTIDRGWCDAPLLELYRGQWDAGNR